MIENELQLAVTCEQIAKFTRATMEMMLIPEGERRDWIWSAQFSAMVSVRNELLDEVTHYRTHHKRG